MPWTLCSTGWTQENGGVWNEVKDPRFKQQHQKQEKTAANTSGIKAEANWSDSISVDGFVEGGIVINPEMPFNGLNWGQLYTDQANTPILNSGVLTIQRPLDPIGDSFD